MSINQTINKFSSFRVLLWIGGLARFGPRTLVAPMEQSATIPCLISKYLLYISAVIRYNWFSQCRCFFSFQKTCKILYLFSAPIIAEESSDVPFLGSGISSSTDSSVTPGAVSSSSGTEMSSISDQDVSSESGQYILEDNELEISTHGDVSTEVYESNGGSGGNTVLMSSTEAVSTELYGTNGGGGTVGIVRASSTEYVSTEQV